MRLPVHRCSWIVTTAILVIAFVVTSISAGAEEGEAIWPQGSLPTGGTNSPNSLGAISDVVGGRAWLISEGLDPGLQERPGRDPLTRLNWSAIGGTGGSDAQRLQAAASSALIPFRNPAPAFSRDILITRDQGGIPIQTEPHLAVNPNDPDHLVMGTIDYNFPSMSTYVSLDGGTVWEGPHQVPYHIEDRVSGGDPVLVFDQEGSVYITGISIGVKEFSLGPIYLAEQVSGITVSRSDDGGYTWPITVSTVQSSIRLENQFVDPSGRLRGTVVVGFLDKPWIASGPHPQDPEREMLYVTYTDFESYYSISYIGELPVLTPVSVATTIRMVSSDDGGISWTTPVDVSPTVHRSYGERGGSGDVQVLLSADRVVQGAQPAVDSDGVLYVAWLDSTDDGSMMGMGEIHVARSDDGGRTFAPPTVASTFNEIGFRPRNAFFRYWAATFPQIAVGPQGDVYVAYTARPSNKVDDDGDIYVMRSTDGGYSFSRPTRINDDRGNALQFYPSISVGDDGHLHVMWLDMRDDPSRIRYHVYYSKSEDRGRTWGFELPEFGYKVRDTRVSDFASNPNRGFTNGLFIGDYVSIQAAADEVYMVWPDTRLGEYGPMNQKIGFARQRAVRQPEIYVQPSAGAGGDRITVQGFDFQPEMNVFVQLQDVTIATARTNREGRFTASLFVPVTGEGPQQVRVYDESGNMSTASYYTEFGFGDIRDMYMDLLRKMEDLEGALEGTQP